MRRPGPLRPLAALVVAWLSISSQERVAAAQVSVCATGTTLEGVDVSVYDGTVDWTEVKSSGRTFGIAKATEDSTLQDAEFAANWQAMKSAGVVRSAYHFFHCDTDSSTQATFFLGVMGALEPGDLPPSLDFEDTTTCTPSTGVAMAITWLDAVASATGTLPTLYTSVRVLSSFDDTASFAGHARLWVASRGVTCPALPSPFTEWSFWQYSLTGTAPGLPNSNGMADLDQFNGDMSALLAITVGGASSGSSSGSGGSSSSSAPACTVDGVEGSCIDTSVCMAMAGYVSTPGLCPGPATEECCTRPPRDGGATSTGSASAGSTSARGESSGTTSRSSSESGRSGGSTSAGASTGSGTSPDRTTMSGGCASATGVGPSSSAPPAALLGLGVVATWRRRRRPG